VGRQLILKVMPKSDFGRNVMTMLSGGSIAQAIPIAISPILTRLYTPEQIGLFALYSSLALIFSSMATARYELAVMLPKKDKDALNLVGIAMSIAIGVSVLSIFGILTLNDVFARFYGRNELSGWFYFIPITVLLTGIYNSLHYWYSKHKAFKVLSVNKVIQSTITAGFRIGFGAFGFGSLGLILSGILGQSVAASVLLGRFFRNYGKQFFALKASKMLAIAREYSKFPKYDLPASVIFVLYSNVGVLFLSRFLDASVVGLYFFANTTLKRPISVLVNSFSEVFYQKISSNPDKAAISNEINHYAKKLLKISLFPFYFVVFCSYYYVEPLFGEGWDELYRYVYIVAMPVYFSLLFAPFGHVARILNRQEVSIYSNLFKVFGLMALFTFHYFVKWDGLTLIYLITVIDILMKLLIAFYINSLLNNSKMLLIGYTLLFLVLSSLTYRLAVL